MLINVPCLPSPVLGGISFPLSAIAITPCLQSFRRLPFLSLLPPNFCLGKKNQPLYFIQTQILEMCISPPPPKFEHSLAEIEYFAYFKPPATKATFVKANPRMFCKNDNSLNQKFQCIWTSAAYPQQHNVYFTRFTFFTIFILSIRLHPSQLSAQKQRYQDFISLTSNL